jgi:hypothetical protein
MPGGSPVTSGMMKVADKTESGLFTAIPDAPVEKRKSPRYSFSATVDAHDILADISIIGRLSDISRNGCYVDTISPFAMGAEIALKITAGSRSFVTDSKVVYSSNGMGMGLLFTTAEPEQIATLETWLRELSGEKVTPARPTPKPAVEIKKANGGAEPELRQIVSELIAQLNGKGVLDDSEAMALLRKLSK